MSDDIHESHLPEGDDEKRFFEDLRYCKRCGFLMWSKDKGLGKKATQPCRPARVELRETAGRPA